MATRATSQHGSVPWPMQRVQATYHLPYSVAIVVRSWTNREAGIRIASWSWRLAMDWWRSWKAQNGDARLLWRVLWYALATVPLDIQARVADYFYVRLLDRMKPFNPKQWYRYRRFSIAPTVYSENGGWSYRTPWPRWMLSIGVFVNSEVSWVVRMLVIWGAHRLYLWKIWF
jgi:hypothetical protein